MIHEAKDGSKEARRRLKGGSNMLNYAEIAKLCGNMLNYAEMGYIMLKYAKLC